MAEYRERASSGGVWRPPSVRHTNALIDLAERHLQNQLGQPGLPPSPVRKPNVVLVKNNVGADLVRGSVVQLGTLINYDDPGTDSWLFYAEDPDPDGSDTIAVLLQGAKTSKVVEALTCGIVFCRLNVGHLQHKRADVDTGETTLQSHWHGRAEILWKETDDTTPATGEQNAIVRLGEMFRGPINAVITETGGISYGGFGDVSVYWSGVAASPASTETGYLNWMTATYNAAENAECQIWWHPDQQKYIIGNLEC